MKTFKLLSNMLGLCYVPSADSPYFTPAHFDIIQQKIKSSKFNSKVMIIGDIYINVWFGINVRHLPFFHPVH